MYQRIQTDSSTHLPAPSNTCTCTQRREGSRAARRYLCARGLCPTLFHSTWTFTKWVGSTVGDQRPRCSFFRSLQVVRFAELVLGG